MSSSSRSIAAARSRRAGESQPPVSGGRPGTSIASHSAFAPPTPPSNNVRVSKTPIQQQQMQQQQQMPQNGLPFSKLSISDAVGLITLRLGRVEQFIIDFEHGEHPNSSESKGSIPENSRIVDNSVLTTIINRLDSLEKREGSSVANSFASLEQVSKMEKDLKDTKDLLSHLLFKLELFTKETNDKFGDFEGAIAEIEKNLETQQFLEINDTMSANVIVTDDSSNIITQLLPEGNISLTTVDLRTVVKQEFAASESN
jgi:hypothetical protein